MSAMVDIEFTDRYGGRVPSRLRSCWRCEAMGCNPEPPASCVDAEGYIMLDCPDEWEFVSCPHCHGTTRVSWLTTAARVPGWLIKGIPFVWRYGVRREFNPEGGRWKSLTIAVGSAWLADLGLWHP